MDRITDAILHNPYLVIALTVLALVGVWRLLRWYIGYIARDSIRRHIGDVRSAVRDATTGATRADAEWAATISRRLDALDARIIVVETDIAAGQRRAPQEPASRANKATPKKGRGRRRGQEAPTQWDRLREDEEPDAGSEDT